MLTHLILPFFYVIISSLCRCDGMVDVTDSKSVGGDTVWVRVPPPAPKKAADPFVGLVSFFFLVGSKGEQEKQSSELFFASDKLENLGIQMMS